MQPRSDRVPVASLQAKARTRSRLKAAAVLGVGAVLSCGEPATELPAEEPPPRVHVDPPITPSIPPERVPQDEFRIATYNINFATRDLGAVVTLIDEADADIVVLQEVTPRAHPYLARHTKTRYPYAHLQPKPWAAGHAVLSKTPLLEVKELPAEHGPFGALLASVELGGRTLQIASVHLKPTLPSAHASKQDVMTSFITNEGIRRAEIAGILAALDPTTPSIVAGDFNTLPSLGVVDDLLQHHFVDAQARDTAHSNDPTWRWVWRGTPLQLRIDYVFHSPHFQTEDVQVLTRGPSDHYPVVATLRW